MATKLAKAVLELSTDTASIKTGLSDVIKSAKATETAIAGVGKVIAGAFTVTAIVAAGKQFLDFAGDVTDLSTRLGISTDTVQKWQLAFGQAGISVEEVAKASEQLSFKLVSGDKSAVAALEKLGFNLEKLKAMRPEDRFTLVADAVGRIQDKGEQLYASRTLFGKAGAELLAGLDGHLGETIAKIEEMGLVIDGETIKAADDFGDQLGLLGRQLLGIVGTVVGPLLPALSALGNTLSWLGRNVVGPILGGAIKVAMTLLGGFVEALTGVLGKLAELGSHIPGVGGKFGEMATALQDVSKRSGAYIANLWQQKAATDGAGEAADGASKKLLGLGGSTEEAGKKAKLFAKLQEEAADAARTAWEKWRDTQEKLRDAEEDAYMRNHDIAVAAYNDIADAVQKAALSSTDYQIAKVLEWQDEMEGAIDYTQDNWADAYNAIAAQAQQKLEEIAQAAEMRDIELRYTFVGPEVPPQFEPDFMRDTFVGPEVPAELARKLAGGFTAKFDELVSTGIPEILQRAFEGGGGVWGAVQSLAAKIGGMLKASDMFKGFSQSVSSSLGRFMSLGSSALAKGLTSIFSGGLSAAIDVGMQLLAKGIKKLFGGPSEKEVKGREIEKGFEDELGGFDAAVNKVGDAYERIGKTREQAAADFKAMLDAEKEGPEAVQKWIDKFREAMQQADDLREKDKESAAELKKELDAQGQARMKAAEDELQGMIDRRNELAQGLAAEAPEAVKGVIETQQEAELAVLDEQIQSKADEYARLARETGQAMAEEIVKALQAIRIAPIDIPVNIEMPEVPHGGVTGAGSDSAYDQSIGMARGAFGRTTGPTWFYSHGNEDFAFGGENKPGFAETIAAQVAAMASGGGSMRPLEITVNTVMDGRTVARSVHRAYNDHGELRTEGRQVLGVRA